MKPALLRHARSMSLYDVVRRRLRAPLLTGLDRHVPARDAPGQYDDPARFTCLRGQVAPFEFQGLHRRLAAAANKPHLRRRDDRMGNEHHRRPVFLFSGPLRSR